MKNIVAKKTLKQFWEKYPDAESNLKTWYAVTMKKQWKSSNEVKDYKNANIVGHNRVVFNICRNKYRLIVRFNYEMQWAWIRFIGTHEEYDKINAAEI